MAMQQWAYTLAVAGCFTVKIKVDGKEEDTNMVDLADLLTHCANAQSFVLTHSQKKERLDDQKLQDELKRHDEAIRAHWADAFRRSTDLR